MASQFAAGESRTRRRTVKPLSTHSSRPTNLQRRKVETNIFNMQSLDLASASALQNKSIHSYTSTATPPASSSAALFTDEDPRFIKFEADMLPRLVRMAAPSSFASVRRRSDK